VLPAIRKQERAIVRTHKHYLERREPVEGVAIDGSTTTPKQHCVACLMDSAARELLKVAHRFSFVSATLTSRRSAAAGVAFGIRRS
jgi:hypothetical protein